MKNNFAEFSPPNGQNSLGRLRGSKAAAERKWLERFLAVFNGIRELFNLETGERDPVVARIRALNRLMPLVDELPSPKNVLGSPDMTIGQAVAQWFLAIESGLSALAVGGYGVFATIRVVGPDGTVTTHEGGTLNPITDRLIHALQTVGPRRLKACENCQKYFLAQRAKSACCSARCDNASRQRRFYRKDKDLLARARQLLSEGKWQLKEFTAQLGVPASRARFYKIRAKEELEAEARG